MIGEMNATGKLDFSFQAEKISFVLEMSLISFVEKVSYVRDASDEISLPIVTRVTTQGNTSVFESVCEILTCDHSN